MSPESHNTHTNYRFVDLSANPKIDALAKILREVSSVKDPAEMLKAFGPWIGERFPRDAFISVSIRDLPEGSYKITRSITHEHKNIPRQSPSGNPWLDWDRLPTYQGGLIGEIIAAGEPSVVTGLDLADDEAIMNALGPYAHKLRSVTAMPAYDDGKPMNWSLSFHEHADWENLDTFVAGLLDMNMMGTATRNLVFRKQAEALNEQLMEQFEQIARIQRRLLPDYSPKLPGYSLATSYLTSNIAGGDYYDFFQLEEDRVGIVIADVSGHGAGAATVMAMMRAILHCYRDTQDRANAGSHSTSDIAAYCNRKLVDANLSGEFATAFFCVIDPHKHTIQWTRCGHNPPIIRSSDGSTVLLESAGSLPLGITSDVKFESDSCPMKPGDTLILYTDGITEAHAPRYLSQGQQLDMFGVDRLVEAVQGCTGKPGCVIDSVHKALYIFTHKLERDDDQTLVVIQQSDEHP
ncbi:MAG: PP2C family protein-serine/threonine phosphatase [Phycisphaerales bacterium]